MCRCVWVSTIDEKAQDAVAWQGLQKCPAAVSDRLSSMKWGWWYPLLGDIEANSTDLLHWNRCHCSEKWKIWQGSIHLGGMMARLMCCWRGQCVWDAICVRMGYQASVRQKNNLSTELIMLVTSALIGGMGCGITLATLVGGGPVYITGLSSIASKEKYCSRSASSVHGNGSNSSLSSNNVGKWKSRKSPIVPKWVAACKGWGGVKPLIFTSL